MCEPNVSSKEERHFLNVLGGWAKLCIAQGAFVVAGIFAIAILGNDKLCDFSHAGSLRRYPIARTRLPVALAWPHGKGVEPRPIVVAA